MLDKITINAHSSIRVGGERVLYFDPFLVTEEPHDADVIFFTHSHYDHFSPKDYTKLAKSDTIFVAPSSMAGDLKKAGIENAILLEPNTTMEIAGVPVETVPAYNIGKLFHPRKNNWLGYVVTVDGQRLYVCGDTDDTPDARKVKCDVILIPVGGTYTTTAKEAASLVNYLNPRYAVPTHYGSAVGKSGDGAKFAGLVDDGITVVIKIK